MKDGREKTVTVIFGVVVSIAVLVCLVGMIYCFISFVQTTRSFNAECRKMLLDTASIMTSDDNADSTSVTSHEVSSEKTAIVDNMITHMESVVAIQERGTTNSLMSFVYGVLSSVLVGLCAKFVATSRNSADEAKKTADLITQKSINITDEMNKALNQTEIATKEANISANEAKDKAKKAEEIIEQAKKIAELATEKALEAEEAIEKVDNTVMTAIVMKYQVRIIKIIIKIVSAEMELQRLDKIAANRLIKSISRDTLSLLKDDEFKRLMCSDGLDTEELGLLYDELLELQQKIDTFLEMCKGMYIGGELTSSKQAAKNYHKWIQEAIDCMDEFSKTT